MHLVQYLQIFSGLCWGAVAAYTATSSWRLLFSAPSYLDPMRGAFFFMGVLQSGFVLRWIMYHSTIEIMGAPELGLWTALYALCGILALWVLKVARAYRGKQF